MRKLFQVAFAFFLFAHNGLFASYAPDSIAGLTVVDTAADGTVTGPLYYGADGINSYGDKTRTYQYEKTSANTGKITYLYEDEPNPLPEITTVTFLSSNHGTYTWAEYSDDTFQNIVDQDSGTFSISYAPTSLVGQTLYISELAYDFDYYFTSKDAYYVDSTGGSNKLWSIPYTYEKNSSTEALLVLSRVSGDVQHFITFTSAVDASSEWSDSSANGSATLTIKQDIHAPDSLVGWTYKGSLINDTFKFIDESNAVFYDSADSNFSKHELSNITYTWNKVGPKMGKITTSLNEETWLFFESNTSGFFDWDEIGIDSNTSAPFGLYYYSVGKAFESLAGSSITIGDTIYVFSNSNLVTIHGSSGTTSQEYSYSYLRENEDEALLSMGSSLYKLDFYNHQYGRIIEGGSGYFSIHQKWAAKGWIYYDDLPWIYSNNQGDWMYQVLSENNATSDTELMYFEPWNNQWSKSLDLNFTDQRVFSVDSEYYWEDYDDFSGSELNSSNWDVGYWGGGQGVAINNGQAQLSGTAFSSSASTQMPGDLLAAAQGATEGNTFLFFKDSEIFGIEADITIPSAGNQIEVGIYLASLDKSPLDSLGIELVNDANGSFIKLDYLGSDGMESEAIQSGSIDQIFNLRITKLDGRTSHYIDGNLVHNFSSVSRDADYWTIGAFNDDGLPYTTIADNVRVLRKKNYPQGWMWTDYFPWVYSHETGGWLYFELAKDTDGNPVMNYYDHKTGSWDLYGPSLIQFYER